MANTPPHSAKPADDTPDELLTPEEAAGVCRVAVSTFRTWLAEGRLPSLRLSRRTLRVRRSDLEAFLRSAEQAG